MTARPGFSTDRSRHLGVLAALLLLALLAGWAAAFVDARAGADRQLTLLQIEARRKSIEVMSGTLNGNLMGAITLLGLTDPGMKREARSVVVETDPFLRAELGEVGRAFGANGVFVVAQDGVIRSSWDWGNKPSTGLDVKFRPYFKTAMAGRTSVYAAVSVSQGERSLYFSAPVTGMDAPTPLGVVVARTDLARVDALLQGEFQEALLLSPQQVVFASKRSQWVGSLAAEASPERLTAIRELKQFGTLFDRRDPKVLPLATSNGFQTWEHRRHAVASAEVDWNDPAGAWTLVLMEDLEAGAPASRALAVGALVAALVLLLGWMGYRLWRGRQKQLRANAQLREFAAQQEATAAFRAELSRLAARLQRCEQLPELASVFLLSAREMLGAMQGALYAASLGESPRLLLLGSAAAGEAPPRALELGQGLLGQCALDRQRRVLDTPPPGPWRLRSGLGNTLPGALVLAPLVLNDELVGVVELALLQPPDEALLARLDDVLALLINSLEILRRSKNASPTQPEDREGRETTVEVGE
ncbi:GAF domain-containing protein [Roseateles sp. P5_E7]